MKKRVARLLAVPFGVGLAVAAWANLAATDAPPPEVRAEMQPVLLQLDLGLDEVLQLETPILTLSQGAQIDIDLNL
jgi:hypothetical protein